MQKKSPMRNAVAKVYVWDPVVRLFHWTLVAAFAVAYLTEDPLIVQVGACYVVGLLLVTRVIWGFVGAGHGRFSDFTYSPHGSLAPFDLLQEPRLAA
jgi:cytochrome b